ncbi:uncharacterized protein [Ambystoma mexicanum]|uniref:uncharacterized protein isoform X2 n=1 Tax=Ambystoma mexicanum TaxID=8296 RepID=UPI0037E9C5D5
MSSPFFVIQNATVMSLLFFSAEARNNQSPQGLPFPQKKMKRDTEAADFKQEPEHEDSDKLKPGTINHRGDFLFLRRKLNVTQKLPISNRNPNTKTLTRNVNGHGSAPGNSKW